MPGNIVNITPAVIASWPPANYVDPYQRTYLPAFAAVFYAVASTMIILRLWLRSTNRAGSFGVDDIMLCLAFFGSTFYTIVAIVVSEKYPIGRHSWDVPYGDFENIAFLTWLGQLSTLFAGGTLKISVLLFYRRLVEGTYRKTWKWAVFVALGFSAGYTAAFMLTLVFNCNPTDAYWKSFNDTFVATHTYSCADTKTIDLLYGLCSAVSDLYSVALPMIMTRHVQMTFRQKVALNIVFCFGLAVVAAGGVRTYDLWQVGHNSDAVWYIYNVYVWSQVELQLGFMAATAPSLRVFFRRYFASVGKTALSSRTTNSEPTELHKSDPESSKHCSTLFGVSRDDGDDRADGMSTKDLAKGSYDGKVIGEQEAGIDTASSEFQDNIKTHQDYEMSNLQTMD